LCACVYGHSRCHTWDWLCGNDMSKGGCPSLMKTENETLIKQTDKKLSSLFLNMQRNHQDTKLKEETPLSFAYWLAVEPNKDSINALLKFLLMDGPNTGFLTDDLVQPMNKASYALAAGGITAAKSVQKLLSCLEKVRLAQKTSKAKYVNVSLPEDLLPDLERYPAQCIEAYKSGHPLHNDGLGDKLVSIRYGKLDDDFAKWHVIPVGEETKEGIWVKVINYATQEPMCYDPKQSKKIFCASPSRNDGTVLFLAKKKGNEFYTLTPKMASESLISIGRQDKMAFVLSRKATSINTTYLKMGIDKTDTAKWNKHKLVWVISNLIFTLGEMGKLAFEALPQLISIASTCKNLRILQVTITAISEISLGCIASGKAESKDFDIPIKEVAELLGSILIRTDWSRDKESGHAQFTISDQIRIEAATGLMKLREHAAPAEKALCYALCDPCGYLQLVAVKALINVGTESARNAAWRMMLGTWFDGTLKEVTF